MIIDLHLYNLYDDVFIDTNLTIKDQLTVEKDINVDNINLVILILIKIRVSL